MSDTQNPDDQNDGGKGPDGSAEPDDKTFDLKYVQGLRTESANYRTQLRDVQAKLTEAKTPEQVADITRELTERNTQLERQILVNEIAGKHGLPKELADALQGADKAALEAHAKVLKKFATSATTSGGSGGLDPNSDEDEVYDPAKLAQGAHHGYRR